jgi:hypothetical protein
VHPLSGLFRAASVALSEMAEARRRQLSVANGPHDRNEEAGADKDDPPSVIAHDEVSGQILEAESRELQASIARAPKRLAPCPSVVLT